ncbi:Lariat debranching enzyme [Fasciola gigantica]|uniref:Lariat debranching enzyme n=1 Tax=Fasciola gigantica TaxID=46835 RepID=A0A504YJE7_FASGI|nr:Lariat debranching enzyme [Fasciola gigantica]
MNFGPRYPGPGPCTGPGSGPGPGSGWGPGGGPDNGWYAQPPWSGGPPFQGSGPGMPPVYRGFGPPPMEVGPPYRGRGYGMLPSYGGPPGPGSRGPYPPHQGYGYSNENYDDYQRRQGSQFQTSANEAGGENAQQELTEADVEQSEKNLKAQYDVLMEKQKAEILDLLDKKRLDAVKTRGEELGMTLEQMNEVIQPLIEACTKENISKGKTWVVERVAASAELTELVTDYMISRCATHNVSFDVRLHLVYLLNDLLHHCKRRGAPTHLQDALQRVVPLVFCLASELADDEKKAKLNRVLDIWESNTYLPPSVLEKMRPPAMETFLREWKETQEQNNQTEVEEIKKNIQSQYASLEQQHKEFTEHVHRQLASSMQQDVSDSGSSDSHHPPYDGPPHSRIQGANSGYGMWNVPPSARGMPPYDMSVAGAVGEGYGNGDPHRRMPPGGYFMPHAQPHHSGGGGYPPPHGGWPGDHGPMHSNWGQPMPPMGPPHFHSHQGYGPPGGRRDRGEGSSGGTVYIEGEEDEEVHEDYERSYDRGYENQYDNYHHYDDRGRDSRADRSYHYRSERSSRFSSSSSRHENSRDESDDSPRDRRRSSHYPSDNGKADAAPPPQEPIVDPKDLEPKCPPWELPAGLMHSLIRLCDFDYTPLDGSKLRLLPPKAPTDRLLSAVDAFYMPPSHDRTRDGEGWERLGLYEFYTKKEKARDHLERMKKKKRDSKTEGDSTPGSDSSSRRRRRYSGSSGAVSPSGDEDSQHADDYEHTRPFSRDESHSNSRPPAYHLCHITAYPASAIGQGVRTGSDALAMAPPPVQCIQGQLTHNYPGYKAVPAPTASGGIAIPPPGQGPVTGPGGAPPTNVPPGFPGPRFFQFPPPSMSQPPPGMPGVPTQGLIQRPTKGSSYGSRRSRFDSRRSRSKSSSRSLSGSGSPPARFTSAPGPGGLGAGGSNLRSGLHAARAAAMAVAASINNARNPNQVASSAGGSWTPGSDGQNGSPYVSGMPYGVDGYNQPGSFDNSYPAVSFSSPPILNQAKYHLTVLHFTLRTNVAEEVYHWLTTGPTSFFETTRNHGHGVLGGYAGVVQFAGLRIAGLSGIYKQHDYTMGHYEHPPYTEATKRSVYHLRNLEVFRLGQIRRRLDIVFSHDWPRGIYHYGDKQALISHKRHFRDEIDTNTLGSPPAEQLFCRLRPRYWFSAHLHCKFAAIVQHSDTSAQDHQTTRFLALDKCLPKRDYLQFVDIDPGTTAYSSVIQTGDLNSSVSMRSSLANEEDQFIVSSVTRQSKTPPDEYSTGDDVDDGDAMREKSDDQSTGLYLDPEWLCILRSTNHLMSTSKVPCILPTPETKERCDFSATSEEIRVLCEPFDNEFAVPDNFERTAPTYKPNDVGTGTLAASTPQAAGKQKLLFSNPQTELICAMLDLVNPNALLLGRESYSLVELSSQLESKLVDEVDEGNEDLDEEENEDTENEDVVDGGEMGPSELDGTQPFDAPLGNLVHEEPSQTDLSWMSSHAEYDPLDNIASSPSHPLLQPQSPPESAFVVKQQLSVSHNPEEVNLDELDDDDDDDGTTNHAGSSGTSPSAAYTTEAYSPQPLDSTYATGMAYPVYENPSDDGKENASIHLDARTAHETSNQSSTSEITGNSG